MVRLVDLCAGLGGFHRGVSLALDDSPWGPAKLVFASELDDALRETYVANFPEVASQLSHQFPKDQVENLRQASADEALAHALDLYSGEDTVRRIPGDLSAFVLPETRELRRWREDGPPLIPAHEILCAGFPCQPFSKSGAQLGFDDLRGTVFNLISIVAERHSPDLIILENVGNFERHDSGNTWHRVRSILEDIGYSITATRHKGTGGEDATGLLSPHHLGFAHHRERFFIVARHRAADIQIPSLRQRRVFPVRPSSAAARTAADASASAELESVVRDTWRVADTSTLQAAQVTQDQWVAISHWNELLVMLHDVDEATGRPEFRANMPSFPIWGFELDPWQWYPIEDNPSEVLVDDPGRFRDECLASARESVARRTRNRVDLYQFPPGGERGFLADHPLTESQAARWIDSLPGYAGARQRWPLWKRRFLAQNRNWALKLWATLDPLELRSWLDRLVSKVPAASHQKLEWNCKGEPLDLTKHILQFRPSGLRVKRFRHVPALVAMTTTQIPIVPRLCPEEPKLGVEGSHGRHLLPEEALQLQGFPANWHLPDGREAAARALGNAVHCGVVRAVTEAAFGIGWAESQSVLGLEGA